VPFGAMERPRVAPRRPAEERKAATAPQKNEAQARPEHRSAEDHPREDRPTVPALIEPGNRSGEEAGSLGRRDADRRPRDDWRRPEKRRGGGRRGGRRRRRGRGPDGENGRPDPDRVASGAQTSAPLLAGIQTTRAAAGVAEGAAAQADAIRPERTRSEGDAPARVAERMPAEGEGMLVVEKGGFGTLRQLETQYLPSRADIFIPQRLIQDLHLRDGSIVRGRIGRGQKHKYALLDVRTVDGKPPQETRNLAEFKSLTTIDPDFHYAVGDATGNVSMRILDVVCPVGRGQRGLIVAPPRAGKTTILRQFAKGIELGYPDVHLMVLLVDERPEEATEWKRSTNGQVFVSTSDESAKTHVLLADTVWKRAMRLVELGQDVVVLLDSITRLARAHNNLAGGSGRTMSGGLDSQAMQKPRQIFGSARNTETAGSLTILGTTLVETGSKMDQLIFEEFKGTGNMELVLSRKLADRRIFPAIDIEKSGTRKEEKLLSSKKLKQIQTLRRVLLRMNFIEAMELLVAKLEEVETNDDFLKRFEVDPEA